MNDRDFKLLVREYFQAKSRMEFAQTFDLEKNRILTRRRDDLEQRILSELELFTQKDVEELPFKD